MNDAYVKALRALEERVGELERVELPFTNIGARVYNSANISVATSTLTTLTFNSERYDLANLHSTSSNTSRLTVARAGVYLITGHIRFDNNATGTRSAYILLNGTTRIGAQMGPASSSFETDITVTALYQLAAGDYVELQAYQSSGATLNALAVGNYAPEFAIHRVA